MPSKFNMKSCLFASIVLNVVIFQNFVRGDDTRDIPGDAATVQSSNTFEIKNPQEFTDKVLNSKDTIIAQFHAPWCTPCKVLSPSLEKAVNEHGGKIKLARVDVAPDDLGRLAQKQGIRSIPIATAYKDGKRVDTMVGLQNDQDVRNFIKKQLD